ncbi:MAG: molecular chaperone DnaJ [Lachnospiraceae bacterium]|jgi:molecular chaperone DnaJ
MAEKRDYYEVLGVPRDADDATIKKAYREIAKKCHPDIDPSPEAAEKFKEASEAYSVLSDKQKRAQYDQFGQAAFENGGNGYSGYSAADFSDLFSDLFGDFFGGGMGGRTRGANAGPQKGDNVRTAVRISFMEAVKGTEKELELNLKDVCLSCHGTGAKAGTSPVTCPKCNGTGQVVYRQQSMFGMVQNIQVCPDCHGTGKIIREKCPDCRGLGYTVSRKKISVTIPAGIDDGQSIRLRGKGDPGKNGGEWGDLLVQVSVSPHPVFKRRDYDIYSTVPISFAQAALGAEIKIPTIDGETEYTVRPGTQTDTQIRLRGEGVPSLRSRNVRGDHYVTLVVQVPTSMNREQKEALRKYDELMTGKEPSDSSASRKKRSFKDVFN